MTDPSVPSAAADPAQVAADTLAGLDPAGLLRQGVDPVAPTASAPARASRWQAPSPAELGALLPQLEVCELIGQGGMGAVYRAVQRHLDRSVALKILPRERGADPDFAARFAREAKALARLNHPNLVAIHDYGQTDGWCWLVMEFVDGANLRQVMHTGRLSPQQALAIVPQLCDALQYAHDEGVVHRDIKPENILLDARGRVKIADFGLAKLRGETPGGEALTGSGAILGTVHYMAPEQVEGAKSVDHRADIYSLGVVFYEMLTGGLPLGRFEPPSRRIELDVRFDEVVLKALEKDPARRYQQASEVQAAVDGAQAGRTTAKPTRDGSGVRIGGLEIDERGVRFGDQVVIDEQGVRIGGKRIGTRTRKDGQVQVLVEGEEVVTERNRYASEAVALIGGALVTGFLAMRQLHGLDLFAVHWLVGGSLLAAPLMLFGGACMQARALPTLAGLGCYASVLPALLCWQHSWWLGSIASLAALWLINTVGGGKWDRHFGMPVPRLHALLLTLLAIIIVAGGIVLIGSQRADSPPPATELTPTDAARVRQLFSPEWRCNGAGQHAFTGISGLPLSRRFIARPLIRWQGVEGSGVVKMWVQLADNSRYFSARAFDQGAVGTGFTAAASAGWHEIPLPFDASASTSPVSDISFEVELPAAGTAQVHVPVLVEDQP